MEIPYNQVIVKLWHFVNFKLGHAVVHFCTVAFRIMNARSLHDCWEIDQFLFAGG